MLLGGAEGRPDHPPWGQCTQDPPCAQARIARTAREHEVLMARNMMSNHTDMQDKYCGDCYDIDPIQSQYSKPIFEAFGRATSFVVSFTLAVSRVKLVAGATILVLHVRVVGHHVPRH